MRILPTVLSLTILSITTLAGYALISSPIEPAAYQPSAAPELTGRLNPNQALMQAELLAAGQIKGPEDVDEDAQGRVYAGLEDGRIVRISEGKVETFVETGGRPLGLAFDPAGNLIVADAIKGMLSIAPDGTLTSLITEVDGVPFGFADDVDVGRDGTIYFSDASHKWGVEDYKKDVIEMRPHGRLIRFDPATGQAETLLQNLYFANGVALSADEDFVLVNETWAYRVMRYWLKGDRAGQSDVFIDNLPGFPDGISRGQHPNTGEPVFWVALFSPRNALLDAAHPYPWVKKLMLALPEFLQPKPVRYGLVLALDAQGNILTSLHDPTGHHLHEVTSVQQVSDHLYLGSLHNDRIGRLSARAALAQ